MEKYKDSDVELMSILLKLQEQTSPIRMSMLDIHLAAMETLEEQLRAGKLDPDDSS